MKTGAREERSRMIHRHQLRWPPGLSFQVARQRSATSLDGYAETWGKLTAKLAVARKDQDGADRQRRGRGRAG